MTTVHSHRPRARMTLGLVLPLVVGLSLALPSPVFALGSLDQSQTNTAGQVGIVGGPVARPLGQTFTPSVTGLLATVALVPSFNSSGWALEIRTVSGGLPTTTVLASETITSTATLTWVYTTFGSPASLTAGTQYAIVVVPPAGAGILFRSNNPAGLPNPYSGGEAMGVGVDGVTWATFGVGIDLAFQTFGPERRPDFRIRKPGGVLKGNNIYNDTAAGQTLYAGNATGTLRQFVLTVQNDGNVSDSFVITEDAATYVGLWSFEYDYGWQPPQDITEAVLTDGHVTPTLAPGAVYYFRVYLFQVDGDTQGDFIDQTLQVQSQADPAKVDRVRFRVTII